MAQQAPTELEGLFDKLHQLIGQGNHAKVIKAADQSKMRLTIDSLAIYLPVQQQRPASSTTCCCQHTAGPSTTLSCCGYWGMPAVLKVAPGDADALACKAVALLQEQEYEAADKVLQHKNLQGQLTLERVGSCLLSTCHFDS